MPSAEIKSETTMMNIFKHAFKTLIEVIYMLVSWFAVCKYRCMCAYACMCVCMYAFSFVRINICMYVHSAYVFALNIACLSFIY